jgi:hypothetical protein
MEGIIHIVAIHPRELWIEGKDVKRMCKFPPRYEWNGTLMKIYYEDGHEEDVNEPVVVEIIGQKPKGVEVETETPPPPAADYENDKLMVVYEEIDRMEIAEREQQKREHPNRRSVQKKGNGVRFLNIAKANDIETVGQLLKVGRVHFEQLRNMGPYCAAKVSEALKNLYGIETW